MTVAAGKSIEVHGGGDPLPQAQADWEVASGASLLLADLRLVGGSGAAAALTVASGGELSLLRVEMGSGSVSFSGAVTVTDCALTGTDLVGSTASAALSLSGGTLTGSSVSLSGGSATLGGSCVAVDSPLSIADGTLSVSGCELRSDGSSVPLTVGSGGSATVTGTVFRSSGGDITAVSVSDGGSLTVGSSELIGADGSADPFPCEGTLPDCAGEHDGSVVEVGPLAVNMAAPLICDVQTGECLCFAGR